MEMKVRSAFIIAERERRAWSQQHLADAAGLALRTIQRIESGGSATRGKWPVAANNQLFLMTTERATAPGFESLLTSIQLGLS